MPAARALSPAPPPMPPIPPLSASPEDVRALSPASLELLDAIQRERERFKPRRNSTLDERVLRTRKAVIGRHLEPDPSRLARSAPDLLPGFRFAFARAFDGVVAAMEGRGFAVHGNRRFTRAAKVIGKQAFELYGTTRTQGSERLGHDVDDVLLKVRLGVGRGVVEKNLLGVLDGLSGQLAACTEPDARGRLVAAGLFPDRLSERLQPMITKFGEAVHGGTAVETTLGASDLELQRALFKVEIVLSRAAVFLDSFVSPEAAQALQEEIPRRPAGRSEASPPPEGGSGTGGESGAATASSTGATAPAASDAAAPLTPAAAATSAAPAAPAPTTGANSTATAPAPAIGSERPASREGPVPRRAGPSCVRAPERRSPPGTTRLPARAVEAQASQPRRTCSRSSSRRCGAVSSDGRLVQGINWWATAPPSLALCTNAQSFSWVTRHLSSRFPATNARSVAYGPSCQSNCGTPRRTSDSISANGTRTVPTERRSNAAPKAVAIGWAVGVPSGGA